jgi:hypothetical protein
MSERPLCEWPGCAAPAGEATAELPGIQRIVDLCAEHLAIARDDPERFRGAFDDSNAGPSRR